MAKITFITLYDKYSPGLRIMSRYLKNSGHKCNTIFFKLAYSGEIDTPHTKPVSGEVFKNWQLKEYAKSSEPWSSVEVDVLLERLDTDAPDIIGISNRSPLDNQCIPLLNQIKRKFPDKLLIAGGWGPLLAPELYLQEVDFVVFGEGEEVILDIADTIDRGGMLDQIQNLIFMKNGAIVRNSVRKPVKNLDVYPLPDYDNRGNCLIDNNRLYETDPVNIFDPEVDTYPLLIGRGCVRGCSYCSEGQLKKLYLHYGRHHISPHRIRSVDHILDECKMAKSRGYKYISILESHLIGSRSFLLDFFQRYGKEIGLPFTAYLHPHQIVQFPEIVDAACKAGFKKGPIGVQHGSEQFCKEFFNRNIPNKLILQVAEMFCERKILTEYQLIAGIPFETENTLVESLNFVKQLPMQYGEIAVSRLKVFPQSPLEQLIQERKLKDTCDPNTWYLTALLYNFRTVYPDGLFDYILQLTTHFMKNRSESALELIPQYYYSLIQIFKRERATIFGPWPLMEKVYRAYLSELNGKPIAVWGSEEFFQRFKDLFEGTNIDAFIPETLERTEPALSILKGVQVRSPEYLKKRILPVFICSNNKEAINRQIRMRFPHITMVP